MTPLTRTGSRESATLAERVDRVFDAEGPLAAVVEGFETRAGQRTLAAAVARTFEDGGTLVAEAGTGTGKTLAYLVPAALAGQRVLISTGTRTLQDQILNKDVPGLARALGRDIRAAYMKGRTNYLCRHRFTRLDEAAASLSPGDRRLFEHIREWTAATETGDRVEIEDLPDDAPIWNEVTATADQCLGRDCQEFAACYVTRMRERAAEAELVIVNHHLLCADAAVREREFGEVIPDCDLAVIDEAHQLEDVATQYFGVSLSTTRVDDFVRDATRSLAPLVKDDRDGAMGAVVRQLGDLHQAARRVFDAARSAITGREGAGERVRLTPELSTDLHDVASALDGALERLAALLAPLVEHRDAAAIGERARAMLADLRVFTTVDEQGHVRFVEGRGRGVSLRAAPIDVSSIIRDTILGRRRSTVLTSATLAVGGTFDYALSRLGLAGASTLQLPSEFDYRRQTLLYLPEEMPDPRSRDFNAAAAREITALLTRTRGRAFVLFTSYAAMRDVHAQLPEDAWPIFVQGTGPRSALLREFRATPHAVLLATASFWQGVDVPGEALSAVIIDRLPFASPGDPLVAARIAAIETRGGNAFSEYQVPLATLTLLQGLGRLIRARTDRGVLAVLDPRLTRMRYGQRFLASMPPAPITNDLARVAQFFEET